MVFPVHGRPYVCFAVQLLQRWTPGDVKTNTVNVPINVCFIQYIIPLNVQEFCISRSGLVNATSGHGCWT